MSLEKIIIEVEKNLVHFEKSNAKVSTKNVAWQMDHILRVIIGICKSLKKSNPAGYKWEFNKIRAGILLTGRIPRGVGKAPQAVMAEGNVSLKMLKEQIRKAKTEIKGVKELSKTAHFKHPYFGDLDLKDSRRFLRVHSRHHLKIIRDIIK